MNVAEELSAIRSRVNKRLSHSVPEVPEMSLPELDLCGRRAPTPKDGPGEWARSIRVYPGLLNSIAQSGKKLLGRSLRWFAYPQTQV